MIGTVTCTAGAHDALGSDEVRREKFRRAMSELLTAYEYSVQTKRELWDFAVEIRRLRSLGLTENDFRWLACNQYVQHAREATRLTDETRHFRPTGQLVFTKRTCFVLTKCGLVFARHMAAEVKASAADDRQWYSAVDPPAPGAAPDLDQRPSWDRRRRELQVDGLVVKRYRTPAVNQELILTAFEEEQWPCRIDDPLPPQWQLDPKRRLNDTIKCLNRKQHHRVIRFRGDGTGKGVVWEWQGVM